jgi:PTS system mannose-specific IID component
VVGTVLRLEADCQAGEAPAVDGPGFQQMVMAPYAAMGDALFWGAVRPLAAVIGLLLAIQGLVLAPLVLLLVYNLPHLLFRCGGLLVGYRQGLGSVATLQRLRLPDVAIRLKEGTILLLGVLCALLAASGCRHQEFAVGWGLLLLPLIFLGAALARRGVTSFVLILITAASLLGLAVLLRV